MWEVFFGLFGKFDVQAKVFDAPSHLGIHAGRISKMIVRDSESKKEIAYFDRSWDFNNLHDDTIQSIVNAIEHIF